RSLFIPLALAIGFSMLASYSLSSSLVPVLSIWLLKKHTKSDQESLFDRTKKRYANGLERLIGWRWAMLSVYAVVVILVLVVVGRNLGSDIFPNVDAGQIKLRLRAPPGTRIERTEQIALKALDVIADQAGKNNVDISIGYVGVQPPAFPVNTIHQW